MRQGLRQALRGCLCLKAEGAGSAPPLGGTSPPGAGPGDSLRPGEGLETVEGPAFEGPRLPVRQRNKQQEWKEKKKEALRGCLVSESRGGC